ncbi:hypothetical protein GE061_014792 [Apolygus lucorum]|uniref:Uncharacterized protein n=1 Tax=Apolygus lucorum TaxID=248454 RepID=A0A6A4JE83_APOLU|nr:hypothetical protein GE061_014792 [Apolygus lucorum]
MSSRIRKDPKCEGETSKHEVFVDHSTLSWRPVTPAFSPCYYASLYQTVLGPTPCQTTTGPECDQGEPDSCSSGPSNSGPSCLNFPGPIRPDTCNSYNCQLPGVPVCDPYSCVPWAQPPCPYKSACPNAKRRGPKSEPFVKISKSEGQIQKMRQMTNDKAERFTAEPVKIRNAESCKNKSNERNSRYSYD